MLLLLLQLPPPPLHHHHNHDYYNSKYYYKYSYYDNCYPQSYYNNNHPKQGSSSADNRGNVTGMGVKQGTDLLEQVCRENGMSYTNGYATTTTTTFLSYYNNYYYYLSVLPLLFCIPVDGTTVGATGAEEASGEGEA